MTSPTYPAPSLATEWEIALLVLRELRADLVAIGQARHHSRDRALVRTAIRAAEQRAIRARRAMRSS